MRRLEKRVKRFAAFSEWYHEEGDLNKAIMTGLTSSFLKVDLIFMISHPTYDLKRNKISCGGVKITE